MLHLKKKMISIDASAHICNYVLPSLFPACFESIGTNQTTLILEGPWNSASCLLSVLAWLPCQRLLTSGYGLEVGAGPDVTKPIVGRTGQLASVDQANSTSVRRDFRVWQNQAKNKHKPLLFLPTKHWPGFCHTLLKSFPEKNNVLGTVLQGGIPRSQDIYADFFFS